MSEVRLIDANALKQDLRQYFTDGVLDGVSEKLVFNQILHDIDNAPTVEQFDDTELQRAIGYADGYSKGREERPQGEWMKEPNGKTTDIYRCSVCKRSIMLCKGADLTNYPFCHCGADMRKGGAE